MELIVFSPFNKEQVETFVGRKCIDAEFLPNHSAPQLVEYLKVYECFYEKITVVMLYSGVNSTLVFESKKFRFVVIRKYARSALKFFRSERSDFNRLSLLNSGDYDICIHWISNLLFVENSLLESSNSIHIQLHDIPSDMLIALKLKYIASILGIFKLWFMSKTIRSKLTITAVTPVLEDIGYLLRPQLLYNSLPEEVLRKIKNQKLKKEFDICVFLNTAAFKGAESFFNFLRSYSEKTLNICIIGLSDLNSSMNQHKLNYFSNLNHSDAVGLIAKSKVLLHFSEYEALPSPIIEARALGVPVICNKYGSILKLYNEDRHTYFLNFNDDNKVFNELVNSLIDNEISSAFEPYELKFNFFKSSLESILRK